MRKPVSQCSKVYHLNEYLDKQGSCNTGVCFLYYTYQSYQYWIRDLSSP